MALTQVTTHGIKDSTVATVDISDNSITSAKIIANSITSSELANGAVTNSEVASDAAIAGSKISPIFSSQILVHQTTAPQIRINTSSSDSSSTRFMFGLATASNQFINGSSSNDSCFSAPSNILFGIGNSRKFRIKSNDVLTDIDFIPSSNDATSLGRTDARWSDLFAVDANISGHLNLPDNSELRLGSADEVKLSHNGSSTNFIVNQHYLNFQANGTFFYNQAGNETKLSLLQNGAVKLYYDNSKKLETTSAGILTTGVLKVADGTHNSGNRIAVGTSEDIKIYHIAGNDSYIRNNTGDFYLQGNNSGTIVNNIKFENSTGATELYYNGVKKLETTSGGVNVIGSFTVNGSAISSGGLSNIVEDTTPQLGGDLQSNGNNIDFADNDAAFFGTGNDLKIFHSGSHSQIIHSGTGNVFLDSIGGSVNLRAGNNAGGVHNSVICNLNEDVELYYDNSKKLETTSTGIAVTGRGSFTDGNSGGVRIGNSDDLQLYHDTINSYIRNNTGFLIIEGGTQNSSILIRPRTTENSIKADSNGTVELYYDNSKKFDTLSDGARVTGRLVVTENYEADDNKKITLGNSQDLQIYHNGTLNVIDCANAQNLDIKYGSEYLARFGPNGSVDLYYDNSLRFQTSSTGCWFRGANTHYSEGHMNPWVSNTYDLGSTSYRWRNGYISNALDFQDSAKAQFGNSDDLQIYHDGGHARIYNTTGYITSNSASGHILRSGSSETMLRTETNAEVKLYYDNSEKLRTTTNGAKVTGNYIELNKGSSAGTAFIIDTTATSGATRFRFRENGSTKGQIVYSHDNNQIELAGDSGQNAAILVNFSEYALRAIANGSTKVYYNGNERFQTTSLGTESLYRAQFTQSGNDFAMKLDATNSGFSTNIIKIHATRGAANNWAFIAADSNHGGGADREFTIRGDGNAYADGTWNNNGADYAEFFESSTGSAIAVGTTVVLENNKVRAATSSDAVGNIIGVVRPKEASQASMTIGNTAWNKWQGKYLTDDFDRYILDEHNVIEWTDADGKEHSYESHAIPSDVNVPSEPTIKTQDENGNKFTHYRLNPNYNSERTYVPRHDRDEWVIVGLVGQVKVLKGQPANDRWIKMRDVSDTVQEYFIR